jgi:L-lactate dehydrogenase complex protein LldG
MNAEDVANLFIKKAKEVNVKVVPVESRKAALSLALTIAKNAALIDPSRNKILAAPSLNDADYVFLKDEAYGLNVEIATANLRQRLYGIEVGLSFSTLGIADTATLAVECLGEDERLCGMISETHVVAINKSALVKTLNEAEPFLSKALAKDRNFVALISGPSRTADIERVLTLGVHGPLELYVALIDG